MFFYKNAIKHCFNHEPQSRLFWTLFKKSSFGSYEKVEVGNVSELKTVPEYIKVPSYAITGEVTDEPQHNSPPEIHTKGQIEMMQLSCKLAKFVLNSTKNQLKIGSTTDEIDCFVHDLIINNNAYPSPLNYNGFKKSVCTSVNNVLCHGVPDDRPLHDGDLVSVDVSVYLNGYHGDCCATYCVGEVDEPGRKLLKIAEECMYRGIGACGPGKSFTDIGKAIEKHAKQNHVHVVSSITGHGVGRYFHGPPVIFHTSLHKYPGIMKPGMIFTIEPVVCHGGEDIGILEDGWTIVSMDDSRGAQFEHTILITESGYDILTV